MTTFVHRCALCAGPLPAKADRAITCEYCGSENVVAGVQSGLTAQLAQATREVKDMRAEVDAKTAELQQKMEAAFARGDLPQALKYQEGMMRMAFAPTIHLYNSLDPADPQIAAALAQIDQAIDDSLRATAESWGAEYVPVAERS
jgi:DNA-directed RNA polymerase subunit RPC12/RpoP